MPYILESLDGARRVYLEHLFGFKSADTIARDFDVSVEIVEKLLDVGKMVHMDLNLVDKLDRRMK